MDGDFQAQSAGVTVVKIIKNVSCEVSPQIIMLLFEMKTSYKYETFFSDLKHL